LRHSDPRSTAEAQARRRIAAASRRLAEDKSCSIPLRESGRIRFIAPRLNGYLEEKIGWG
jgi:hypothetical protein